MRDTITETGLNELPVLCLRYHWQGFRGADRAELAPCPGCAGCPADRVVVSVRQSVKQGGRHERET